MGKLIARTFNYTELHRGSQSYTEVRNQISVDLCGISVDLRVSF